MKQNDCIKAYMAINNVCKTKFPGQIAFQVFKLKKVLGEIFDFQKEQEQEIFAEYEATFTEDGSINLKDETRAEEFVKRIEEMALIEHEEIQPIAIPAACFEEISVEELEKLDGIIEFVE